MFVLLQLACAGAVDSAVDSPKGSVGVDTVADSPAPVDTADSDTAPVDSDTDTGCPDAWADVDGDGFGDATSPRPDCAAPGTWVVDATDCDDAAADVYPGAAERCDGVDDDCDAATDEAGLVTASGGVDVTATWAAGSPGAPAAVDLDAATYDVCGGPFYVNLVADAAPVVLTGHDATLDGGGTGTVVTVDGAELTLTGFTLQGGEGSWSPSTGAAPAGGAVACGDGATVSASDTTFADNHAAIGGAFVIDGCDLTLAGVEVSGNSAGYGGGGYGFGGSLVVTDSAFRLDTATSSGGALGTEGVYASVDVSLDTVTFEENGAVFGGGLVVYEDSTLVGVGVVLHGNTGESSGGGIFLTGGDFDPHVELTDSDLGTGDLDNDPEDLLTNAGGYSYDLVAHVVCDNDGCS